MKNYNSYAGTEPFSVIDAKIFPESIFPLFIPTFKRSKLYIS